MCPHSLAWAEKRDCNFWLNITLPDTFSFPWKKAYGQRDGTIILYLSRPITWPYGLLKVNKTHEFTSKGCIGYLLRHLVYGHHDRSTNLLWPMVQVT